VCDLETSRMAALYIYDISRLRVSGYNTNFYNRYSGHRYLFRGEGKHEKDHSLFSNMKV